jgi:hypothetical protein
MLFAVCRVGIGGKLYVTGWMQAAFRSSLIRAGSDAAIAPLGGSSKLDEENGLLAGQILHPI